MCPEVEPDFSDVVECTPGKYQARITREEATLTNDGRKMLVFHLELENAGKLNGKKLKHRVMLEGPGLFGFKKFVRATYDPNYSGGKTNTDAALGTSVQIEVIEGKDKSGHPNGFPEVKSVSRLQ